MLHIDVHHADDFMVLIRQLKPSIVYRDGTLFAFTDNNTVYHYKSVNRFEDLALAEITTRIISASVTREVRHA